MLLFLKSTTTLQDRSSKLHLIVCDNAADVSVIIPLSREQTVPANRPVALVCRLKFSPIRASVRWTRATRSVRRHALWPWKRYKYRIASSSIMEYGMQFWASVPRSLPCSGTVFNFGYWTMKHKTKKSLMPLHHIAIYFKPFQFSLKNELTLRWKRFIVFWLVQPH